MNMPDGIRGAENEGNPPSPDGNASEAIRLGNSRPGITAGAPPYASRRPVSAPPASKTKWLGAAVVLALLVFGITYGLTRYGSSGKPADTIVEDGGSTEQLKLAFVTQKMPPQDDGDLNPKPPIDVESGKEGWADYWFENKNEKPVAIGMLKTSCTCSGAELFLLPPGSKMTPGREAELEKTVKPIAFTGANDESLTIGPVRVGWVRLKWSGERRPEKIDLTLWLNSRAVGPFPILEARLQFHEPLKVDPKLSFDGISATKLPYKKSIICWSVTRKTLVVTAEITGGRKGTAEPLELGTPEPLTAAECKVLAPLVKEQNVLSACRIPLTLRSESKDGTQVDAGPFRRHVELSLEGHAGEPLVVEAYGLVLGDVNVLGLSAGRIEFPRFDSKKGSTVRTITLSSTTGLKKLELDPRTAEFLDVELLPGKTGAAMMWQLKVSVREGAMSGTFPRDRPEEYRDSAVYVRPVGDAKARATRIAVEGSATD